MIDFGAQGLPPAAGPFVGAFLWLLSASERGPRSPGKCRDQPLNWMEFKAPPSARGSLNLGHLPLASGFSGSLSVPHFLSTSGGLW